MTTPGSQAGPTAADDGSVPGSPGPAAAPGLARPYADPARGYVTGGESGPGRQDAGWRDDYGYDAELPPGWPGAADPAPEAGAVDAPAAAGDPAELFPADSQAGGSWPEPDLGSEEQVAADVALGGRAGADQPGPGGASITHSSGVMAVGTIASRVTGFLRTAILIYAVGTHDLGNSYQLANTVPNAVYNLALGGVLTSVVVPLLVSAARRDRDRGEAYDQRIFTFGVLALGGITVLATLAAAPLTSLYGHGIGNAATYHLTVIFAYFFLPQIFFYGVSSLAGAILNARGRFGAPMWTPVINNMVVIGVGVLFMVTAGVNRTPQDISSGEIALLGIGTTLGIILQTAALVPSLRRVGFRWRPRFDFRRSEVSEIGRMGGWMFGYVGTTQLAFLVTARVANAAGARVPQQAAGAGYAAYSNAWQLFQLPYAIVGISVITAMLPRMSSHAAAREYRLVSDDFSAATRLASVIVVPAALILAVLGPPLAEALFAYGSTHIASARYLGEVFAVFSLGLLPYMLFQLQLRVFYSMHDSRTPALIGVATMVLNIAANYIALAILPARDVVAGLGAGFGLANLLGCVLAGRVLARRLGGLDGYLIRRSLVRMHVAAGPAALLAILVSVLVGSVISAGEFNALATVVLAGGAALALYVLLARVLHITELTGLIGAITSRLRR
jgi:putative peptidoglycan lipid II flippase